MPRHLWVIFVCALALSAQSGEGPPVMRRKAPPEPVKEEPKKPEEKKPATEEPDDPAYPRTQRPVPRTADDEDPGRPKLKRGAGAPRLQPESLPPQDRPVTPALREVTVDSDGRVVAETAPHVPSGIPLIERARAATVEFNSKLPDYICDQFTLRYQSETRVPDWKLQDRIELELAYYGGREEYRNLRRNGKPLKGSPEDTGTWSKYDFGTVLANLMAPGTDAHFRRRGSSTAAGLPAEVFDYSVEQANARWQIKIGEAIMPAYRGSIWVDPKTARVLRVELRTREFPSTYKVDTVELTVEYGWVLIGGQRHLLPTKSENLACFTSTFTCTRNEIDFRNYRKFSAESQVLQVESDISFPEAEEKKPPAPKPTKKK